MALFYRVLTLEGLAYVEEEYEITGVYPGMPVEIVASEDAFWCLCKLIGSSREKTLFLKKREHLAEMPISTMPADPCAIDVLRELIMVHSIKRYALPVLPEERRKRRTAAMVAAKVLLSQTETSSKGRIS